MISGNDTSTDQSPTPIIDLRALGAITAECERYLAQLVAFTCSKDGIKHRLSLAAREDFGWDGGLLMNYVVAEVITDSSTRVAGFISSGEWLCGVFSSGSSLGIEHLRILMSFVNCFVPPEMVNASRYITGKCMWREAPSPLKELLNVLDDAAVNGAEVEVKSPKVCPINPSDTNEELEKLDLSELKKRVVVKWD